MAYLEYGFLLVGLSFDFDAPFDRNSIHAREPTRQGISISIGTFIYYVSQRRHQSCRRQEKTDRVYKESKLPAH